jgi:hypothetical protein
MLLDDYDRIDAYRHNVLRDIDDRHRRLIAEPSHVRRVIRRGPDYDEVLQVERVVVTDEGTIVYVK